MVKVVGIRVVAVGQQAVDKASKERNRQLDMMEAAQREQSRTQAEALGWAMAEPSCYGGRPSRPPLRAGVNASGKRPKYMKK